MDQPFYKILDGMDIVQRIGDLLLYTFNWKDIMDFCYQLTYNTRTIMSIKSWAAGYFVVSD